MRLRRIITAIVFHTLTGQLFAFVAVFAGMAGQILAQSSQIDSARSALAAASTAHDHRSPLQEYIAAHPDDGRPSTSSGSVSQGSLRNGKLFPFTGPNFRYYDTLSYLDGRAFVHSRVLKAVLTSYAAMDSLQPGRRFTIMECSKPEGGKIRPHRTHQNGMSIDFMVPMSRNGQPCHEADTLGFSHYLLDFDTDGGLAEFPDARIDFEAMAQHLLALNIAAKASGLRITKVLVRGNLLDNLFSAPSGPRLKATKLYFPSQLEPLIDGLHDNHYHVDFAPIGG